MRSGGLGGAHAAGVANNNGWIRLDNFSLANVMVISDLTIISDLLFVREVKLMQCTHLPICL